MSNKKAELLAQRHDMSAGGLNVKYMSDKQDFTFETKEKGDSKHALKNMLTKLQLDDGTTSSKCLLAGCSKSSIFGQVRFDFKINCCI